MVQGQRARIRFSGETGFDHQKALDQAIVGGEVDEGERCEREEERSEGVGKVEEEEEENRSHGEASGVVTRVNRLEGRRL